MKIRIASLHAVWLVLALLAPVGAFAQTPTPVETPVDWSTTGIPTPEPIATPDATLEETSGPSGPVVHGFVTARYLIDDGAGIPYQSENGYDVQYARVNVDGKAHPLVRYFLSMELGDVKFGSGNIFREAFVLYRPSPANKWVRRFLPEFRAGRMKRPGGLESYEDEGTLLAMDRTLLSGFLKHDDQEAAGQDFRDIGIRVNAGSGPFEVMVLGMSNGKKTTSTSDTADDDDSKDFAGRVGLKFGDENGPVFVRTGASAMSGQDDHTHIYGGLAGPGDVAVEHWTAAADVKVKAGPAFFQSEAAYGKRTLLDAITKKGFDTATGSAAYVMFGYEIKGKTTPFFRYAYREPSLGTKVEDEEDDFVRPRDWSNEVTAGVNVAIVKKRLTARAQYTLRSGFVPPHPSAGGFPGFNSKMNGLAAASIQADF